MRLTLARAAAGLLLAATMAPTASARQVQTCTIAGVVYSTAAPPPGYTVITRGEPTDPEITAIGDTRFVGTDGPDLIIGTDGDDAISGLGGDDVICGKGGRDGIDGGAGDDRVKGGPGPDLIGGGDGDDLLLGKAGNDFMLGGRGRDVLRGGEGDDLLYGGVGDLPVVVEDDQIDGGPGSDRCLQGAAIVHCER